MKLQQFSPFWSIALVCVLLPFTAFSGEFSQSEKSPLQIVAFGDSTTAVYDWKSSTAEVYAQCLPRSLARQGIAVDVINAGIGDTTTREGRERLDRDVRAHQPNLVIIQFGINDSWIDIDIGRTKPRLTREEFRDNLGFIISQLQSDGAAIILMTPNPMRWDDPFYIDAFQQYPGLLDTGAERGLNALLDVYAADVREVARHTGVILIDVLREFEDYGQQSGQPINELLIAGDGIHPSEKGQSLVCALLTKGITEWASEAVEPVAVFPGCLNCSKNPELATAANLIRPMQ